MGPPSLYILSGLPGTGKSALAEALARRAGAAWLRIDTVEQALRDLCGVAVGGEGYRLSHRVAADILRGGVGVVADSCNPLDLTRREWEAVARGAGAVFVNVEVVCSDPAEHRRRVETRRPAVPGLVLPTWEEVVTREYHPWHGERLVVDSARLAPGGLADLILDRRGGPGPAAPQ